MAPRKKAKPKAATGPSRPAESASGVTKKPPSQLLAETKHGWGNGQRPVFILFALMAAVALVAAVAGIVALITVLTEDEHRRVQLEYTERFVVVPNQVAPGVEVAFIGFRCNYTDQLIDIRIESVFEPAFPDEAPLDEDGTPILSLPFLALGYEQLPDVPPGCASTGNRTVPFPTGIPPGRWHTVTRITYVVGGERQAIDVLSESFTVLP